MYTCMESGIPSGHAGNAWVMAAGVFGAPCPPEPWLVAGEGAGTGGVGAVGFGAKNLLTVKREFQQVVQLQMAGTYRLASGPIR